MAPRRRRKGGGQDAFNELYHLTRDRAHFVALSITRNEQDALDIVQDAYLKAWQGIGNLQKPEQFPAWLRQTTGNAAKDYIKKRKPAMFASGGGDDGPSIFDLQPEEDGEYIPDVSLDTAETRRLIMAIVDELPEDQRLCVLMYYYDEIPLGEIAATLDVPVGTVKKRLHLARKKISDGVEGLEKEHGVKLYGAAPIPLLIWLLKGAASTSAANLPPVILGSTAAAGTAAGGITAAAASSKVAAAVALPKVVAAVAATGLYIIGAAALQGTGWLDSQPDGPVYAGSALYIYKGLAPPNTSLTIRPGKKSIGWAAFQGQYNIVSVTFPDTLLHIGNFALSSTLITTVDIPPSVTRIGSGAFAGNVTIYGAKGSAAETYAAANGNTFVPRS